MKVPGTPARSNASARRLATVTASGCDSVGIACVESSEASWGAEAICLTRMTPASSNGFQSFQDFLDRDEELASPRELRRKNREPERYDQSARQR
jgi:hypothetical protein